MVNRPGLDFSFSGLKTHTLNTVAECTVAGELSEQDKCDIALAFEEAVVATLVIKCRRALRQEQLKTLVIAGGVSANTNLRQQLSRALAKEGARVFYPAPRYCTDNGAMIAYAGAQRLQAGQVDAAITAGAPALADGRAAAPGSGRRRLMDIVFIRELRADTVIGVYDWERSIRQSVVLDLEMATDNRLRCRQ